MHNKINFQGKIEGRKEAVYLLKTACKRNVPVLLNIFSYEIFLSCRTLENMTVSPCLDIATLSSGAYL
jgi:hypothetical protein